MNFIISIYIFFQVIYSSFDDKQHKANKVLNDSNVYPLCDDNLSEGKNQIHEIEETNNINQDKSSEKHNNIDGTDEKKSSLTSEINITDANLTSTELNECSDEINKVNEEKLNKTQEQHMTQPENSIHCDEQENIEFNIQYLAPKIPKKVDMNYIKKNNIPYDKICKIHVVFVDIINLICNVCDHYEVFLVDEVKYIKQKNDNRMQYYPDFLDTAVLGGFYDLTKDIKEDFGKLYNRTIGFFINLLDKKNEALVFAETLKDFESVTLLTIRKHVVVMRELRYNNINLIINSFFKQLQKNEEILRKIIYPNNTVSE